MIHFMDGEEKKQICLEKCVFNIYTKYSGRFSGKNLRRKKTEIASTKSGWVS